MMTCSRNLSKNLKNCYKTKINKEMFQHDFQFFCKYNNFFLPKTKWSNILFSYLFFTFVQNFKPKKKKLVMTRVFECFQSHCQMFNYMNFCIWASIEATILYNDSQHNIPALQGTANKRKHLDIWCKWSVWG